MPRTGSLVALNGAKISGYSIETDLISRTSGSSDGVTIEGVEIKDGVITPVNAASVTAPHVGGVTDSFSRFATDNLDDVLNEIGEVRFLNGFNRRDPASLGKLGWDDATRTFSIEPDTGNPSFYFWSAGKKYTKTIKHTVTIPDVTGTYYLFFDETGTIDYVELASFDINLIYTYALFGLVYWNATAGTGDVGDEMHGIDWPSLVHAQVHLTVGARYEKGMDIEGLTDGGTAYTQTTSGVFWDEDVDHTVLSELTHPFMYRLGTAGEWTHTTPDSNVSLNDGGTYDVWNKWDGSTWILEPGTSSTDYWIIFTMATPSFVGNSIRKVVGQNAYSSRSKARAAIENEINDLKTNGLPSPEFVFLHAWIVNRYGKLQKLADGSLYVDLRKSKGGVYNDSAAASYAINILTDTTNFARNLSSTDTDVQKALETLDGITPGYAPSNNYAIICAKSDHSGLEDSSNFTYNSSTGTLSLKGVASSTADLFNIKTSAGTEKFVVEDDGITNIISAGAYSLFVKDSSGYSAKFSRYATYFYGAGLTRLMQNDTANANQSVELQVRGYSIGSYHQFFKASSQSGGLGPVYFGGESGTSAARLGFYQAHTVGDSPRRTMYFYQSTFTVRVDDALSDSLMNANDCTISLDESGNTLTFKVKYSDGTTIKSGTVSLS